MEVTNLITEARELHAGWMAHESIHHGGGQGAKSDDGEMSRKFMLWLVDDFPELCDALENANEQNKQLMHELCRLACESVEREKTLAKLEAEVGVALGKGCDYCGLIYAIHAESYGIEDLDCANEPIDNKFCPMCGKRLEEHHDL